MKSTIAAFPGGLRHLLPSRRPRRAPRIDAALRDLPDAVLRDMGFVRERVPSCHSLLDLHGARR